MNLKKIKKKINELMIKLSPDYGESYIEITWSDE